MLKGPNSFHKPNHILRRVRQPKQQTIPLMPGYRGLSWLIMYLELLKARGSSQKNISNTKKRDGTLHYQAFNDYDEKVKELIQPTFLIYSSMTVSKSTSSASLSAEPLILAFLLFWAAFLFCFAATLAFCSAVLLFLSFLPILVGLAFTISFDQQSGWAVTLRKDFHWQSCLLYRFADKGYQVFTFLNQVLAGLNSAGLAKESRRPSYVHNCTSRRVY